MANDFSLFIRGREVKEWERIEATFDGQHSPGRINITVPQPAIDIIAMLADDPPEIVVKFKGEEWAVGQADEDDGTLNPETPDGMVTIDGRDLTAKFVRSKIVEPVPQNTTASGLVAIWAKSLGFTTTDIHPTSESIGEFVRHNYSRVTKGLSRYDVLFDLAANEGFVFRVYGRKVYFGPEPEITAGRMRSYTYGKDCDTLHWRKSHNNKDVKIRVLGWNGKGKGHKGHGRKVTAEAGTGSIIITRIYHGGLTPLAAKNIANKMLTEAERFLLTEEVPNLPGDPKMNDPDWGIRMIGVGKGLSQDFRTTLIHHVITQDDHVMDLHLLNNPRKIR